MEKIKISAVTASEILDSRGNPTLLTRVELSDSSVGAASVPSGASTGSHEAKELRDGDRERYGGKGVLTAVNNVNTVISPLLSGLGEADLYVADRSMLRCDGTEDKSVLGANAILSVSMALARALAQSAGLPLWKYLGGILPKRLPAPMMNILNGGAHASNNVDIQEFMIVPVGFESFSESLRAGCEIYRALGEILRSRSLSLSVGDEGGYAPNLETDVQAVELVCEAIIKAGYTTDAVKLALDAAATEWRGHEDYTLPKRGGKISGRELIDEWDALTSKYPIISVEDGLAEDDFELWSEMTEKIGNRVMLVGDDLFVTNAKRLKTGIEAGAGNAILIKPNQIGTVTETLEVIDLTRKNGYHPVISHRSGETSDDFISDLAVAVGASHIKAGAPARGERVAKYNRLLQIEGELLSHRQ